MNLRTGLQRTLKRASVDAWPKLFQNPRASRETELMRTHPAHVVYAWLGNSQEVAQDHYLMVTDEDFARAAGSALHNPVHSSAVRGLQWPPYEKETAVSPRLRRIRLFRYPHGESKKLLLTRETQGSHRTATRFPTLQVQENI